MIILRIKYIKENNMKHLSHLELIKTMERAFRRMQFKMKFSQGFNPKPKISYAAPLPVGVESECDYLDVELEEKVDIDDLLAKQEDFLPNGIKFLEAKYHGKSQSLMSLVSDSAYIIRICTSENLTTEIMKEKIDHFVNRDDITFEKLNKRNNLKVIDIKPWIGYFDVLSVHEDQIILKTLVRTGSNGNLKPEKLIEMFCEGEKVVLKEGTARYRRVELYARNKQDTMVTLFEV